MSVRQYVLLGVAALIFNIRQTISVSVESALHCDNHLAVFWSDDGFDTYTTINNPKDNYQSDPNNNKVAPFSFEVPGDAVLRFGCWDYGGGRFLTGKITVDGTDYPVTANGDYVLVGWEETCADPDTCSDQWNTCHEDVPDTLNDMSSITLPNPNDVLVAFHSGFWPQSVTSKCGIFWADFALCDFEEYELIDGECKRKDCETFAIDEFLSSCSVEFAAAESDISELQDALDDTITDFNAALAAETTARENAIAVETAARVAAIAAEVTARDNAISAAVAVETAAREAAFALERTARETAINTAVAAETTAREAALSAAADSRAAMQIAIDDLIDRMDTFRPLSQKANAVGMDIIDDGYSDGGSFWSVYKDILVTVLLVMNAVMMFYIFCKAMGKHGYSKVVQFTGNEAESVNLNDK